MKSYECKTCGAELIINDETTFTSCLYCGNNIAITQKEYGDLNIKKMIPFSIDKDEAIKSYSKVVRGDIIFAKKVYVPVRFCSFDYDFLFYYEYERKSTDSDGNTQTTYIDTEELLDGNVVNEMIFGDSKINYVNMPQEIRNIERVKFDPVLLKDVSIEKSDFRIDDKFKQELEEMVRRYCRTKFSEVTKVYSENYFVSNIKLDDYSTLIPVYIVKTSKGEIYNLPGVEPSKFKKSNKKNNIAKIICLMFVLVSLFFLIVKGLFLFIPITFMFFVILLVLLFNKSTYLEANTYDNFSFKRYSYGNTRKKMKL